VRVEVQCGQRLAAIGIADTQKGQSFVVGAAAGASFSFLALFMVRMRRNTAKATMRKLTMEFAKRP
jgi:hypothetical protein